MAARSHTNPAVSAEQYRLAQAVLSGTVYGPSHMSVSVAREIVDRTPKKLRSEYSKFTRNPFYGTDLDLETEMVPAWMYYATKQERDTAARMYEGRGKKVVLGHSMFGFSEGGGKKWRLRGVDHRGNPLPESGIIGHNRKALIEAIFSTGHDAVSRSLRSNFQPEAVGMDWVRKEFDSRTKLRYGGNGNYSLKVHSNQWYDFKSPVDPHTFGKKQNPQFSADGMYASFHGEPTDEIIEFLNEEHYHSHLAALGELVELKVKLVNGGTAVIGFEDTGEDDQVENPQREYKTEASFKKALAKVTADGTLVHWYGTDHGWVIVTKKMVGSGQKGNPFWPFNSFTHSTIYHVGTGEKYKAAGTFKGYTLYRKLDTDEFLVPALDKDSRFDTVKDAKAFVDSWTKHAKNPGGPLDTHAAKELELYTENDADLYRQQYTPINKNLITKMARGVYKHGLAVKLFGYLMESGAKKYAKEFSVGTDWHQIFSPATRKHVAELFASNFETEASLGNYDSLLPKKYADWRKKNPGPFHDTGQLLNKGRKALSKPMDDFLGTAGKVGGYLDDRLGRALNPANKDTGPVILATNENGDSLFVIGGDQSLDLAGLGITGDMASKESIVIGDIKNIIYHTHKVFDGKPEEFDYTHKAGEVTGDLPVLRYDRINRRLHIDGGAYKIGRPLMDTSPGLEN